MDPDPHMVVAAAAKLVTQRKILKLRFYQLGSGLQQKRFRPPHCLGMPVLRERSSVNSTKLNRERLLAVGFGFTGACHDRQLCLVCMRLLWLYRKIRILYSQMSMDFILDRSFYNTKEHL